MAIPPVNTYGSALSLALGHVPQVDDPALYEELLDLHNAIEALVTHSDTEDTTFAAFIAKFRANIKVTADHTILITEGTIEVDASAGDITITLPLIADGIGYRYDVKRIDTVTASKVTLVGDPGAGELVDDHALGINISTKSSYTVKGNYDEDGWNIL